MVQLTPAQQRVLDFIQTEIHAENPIPTLREIAAKFGFTIFLFQALGRLPKSIVPDANNETPVDCRP